MRLLASLVIVVFAILLPASALAQDGSYVLANSPPNPTGGFFLKGTVQPYDFRTGIYGGSSAEFSPIAASAWGQMTWTYVWQSSTDADPPTAVVVTRTCSAEASGIAGVSATNGLYGCPTTTTTNADGVTSAISTGSDWAVLQNPGQSFQVTIPSASAGATGGFDNYHNGVSGGASVFASTAVSLIGIGFSGTITNPDNNQACLVGQQVWAGVGCGPLYPKNFNWSAENDEDVESPTWEGQESPYWTGMSPPTSHGWNPLTSADMSAQQFWFYVPGAPNPKKQKIDGSGISTQTVQCRVDLYDPSGTTFIATVTVEADLDVYVPDFTIVGTPGDTSLLWQLDNDGDDVEAVLQSGTIGYNYDYGMAFAYFATTPVLFAGAEGVGVCSLSQELNWNDVVTDNGNPYSPYPIVTQNPYALDNSFPYPFANEPNSSPLWTNATNATYTGSDTPSSHFYFGSDDSFQVTFNEQYRMHVIYAPPSPDPAIFPETITSLQECNWVWDPSATWLITGWFFLGDPYILSYQADDWDLFAWNTLFTNG